MAEPSLHRLTGNCAVVEREEDVETTDIATSHINTVLLGDASRGLGLAMVTAFVGGAWHSVGTTVSW